MNFRFQIVAHWPACELDLDVDFYRYRRIWHERAAYTASWFKGQGSILPVGGC
jgi:hypothetical protein